jgi:uncharacterized protein (TIGR02391 family)
MATRPWESVTRLALANNLRTRGRRLIDQTAAVALPIDELALVVLRDLIAVKEWNSYNYGLNYNSAPIEVRHAIAEALGWLASKVLMAREPGQTTSDAIFVTRRGHQAAVEGLEPLRAAERLQADLHPELERLVRRQFLLGEYGLAVFAAMRQVEIRLRSAAGASDSLVASRLARQVFGKDGALADASMDDGEHVARMELFAGSLGFFKNPSSHREVDYRDATEAAEVIFLADLLMRILDRIEEDAP